MKRTPDCHPERSHRSRGMCDPCYQKFRASPQFVKSVVAAGVPTCGHPARKIVGHGKCKTCYSRWIRSRDGSAGKLKRRADRILSTYGITLDQFAQLRKDQGDRCALCCRVFGSDASVHIDHCHETQRVRGLLCFSCNKALGMLGDNETGIQRALAYIRGAPVLMKKLDAKLAARCGLAIGTGTPKAFIHSSAPIEPEREHRSAA